MKSLGIVGGLGPMATAYLLQLVIEMTDAKTDQEHLEVFVLNRPQIPDRTAHILNPRAPSPLPLMRETAQALERLGAGCLCTPCVTAHHFYRELQESVSVPFLNMVAETAQELQAAGKKRVGILATTGTVHTGLFQSAFSNLGLEAIPPDQEGQAWVMSLIYDEIKAGKPADPMKFQKVSEKLRRRGCDSIVLGCTELSLIKKSTVLGSGYLDALEVLAKRCIQCCGGTLKSDFETLLT